MRLFLIRHAESQGNSEFRLQGRKDFPLTERGWRQAEALAARLAGAGIEAVYASPLSRTMQTAEVLGEKCGLAVVPEERVQEYDFGETISGLTWDTIREKHPDIIEALMREGDDFPRYPGEEGRGAFRERVCAAIGEIVERHKDGGPVAVVTHAGPIVVYVMESLGRRYARPIPFAIDNASLTTVEIGEPRAFAGVVVTGLNDTCHVREAEAPKPALDLAS